MTKKQLNNYVTASAFVPNAIEPIAIKPIVHTHPLRRRPKLNSEEQKRSKSPSVHLSATAPLSYIQ